MMPSEATRFPRGQWQSSKHQWWLAKPSEARNPEFQRKHGPAHTSMSDFHPQVLWDSRALRWLFQSLGVWWWCCDSLDMAVHSECQECQSWPPSSSLLRVCLWWHRGTRCHLHLRPYAYWFLEKYDTPQAESPSAVMNIVWQQHPSAPRCDMLPWDWRGKGKQHKWVDANLLSKSNSYVFCQHLWNSKRLIY